MCIVLLDFCNGINGLATVFNRSVLNYFTDSVKNRNKRRISQLADTAGCDNGNKHKLDFGKSATFDIAVNLKHQRISRKHNGNNTDNSLCERNGFKEKTDNYKHCRYAEQGKRELGFFLPVVMGTSAASAGTAVVVTVIAVMLMFAALATLIMFTAVMFTFVLVFLIEFMFGHLTFLLCVIHAPDRHRKFLRHAHRPANNSFLCPPCEDVQVLRLGEFSIDVKLRFDPY